MAVLATVEPVDELALTPLAREGLVLVGPTNAGLAPAAPVRVWQVLTKHMDLLGSPAVQTIGHREIGAADGLPRRIGRSIRLRGAQQTVTGLVARRLRRCLRNGGVHRGVVGQE